jgi:hypothetical protein
VSAASAWAGPVLQLADEDIARLSDTQAAALHDAVSRLQRALAADARRRQAAMRDTPGVRLDGKGDRP